MSISDSESYKLDVNNFLGNKYSSYKNTVLQHSIADPSGFLKMREEVIDKIKTSVVSHFYENIFSILSMGQLANSRGEPDGSSLVTINNVGQKVSYPKQEINNLAVSIASTIDDFLDKICDIVIPTDYIENVKNSFITKSKAAIIS
jgi:hypothetical protein